jgi:hypothetical protein
VKKVLNRDAVAGLLEDLSARGISVRVDIAQGLLVLSPSSAIDDSLAARVREAKPELLRVLGNTDATWPAATLDAVRKFGDHGRFFPFIGRRVWTPRGFGELFTVFEKRAEVRLERTGAVAILKPADVVPEAPQ